MVRGTVVIEAEDLRRRFGEVVAVDGLSLEINAGEVFGLLGHNGAGKTTTIRLFNGVLPPDGGRVRVLGLDPVREGTLLRRRTGVLTEIPALDGRLTARENLAYYAALYGVPRSRVRRRVGKLLAKFGLSERADELAGNYSKGMQQRLALARALLHGPELLFLDEPTAGLDPVAAREVHALVQDLSQAEGRTVVLCTHNLLEAQRLCHRVAVLEHGRLVASGSPAELVRSLSRGLRVEIELSPEDREVVEALRGLPGILEVVKAHPGILEVKVASHLVLPEIARVVVGAGGSLFRLSPREPTLEEVYFALHGREEAG